MSAGGLRDWVTLAVESYNDGTLVIVTEALEVRTMIPVSDDGRRGVLGCLVRTSVVTGHPALSVVWLPGVQLAALQVTP